MSESEMVASISKARDVISAWLSHDVGDFDVRKPTDEEVIAVLDGLDRLLAQLPTGTVVVPQGGGICHYCGDPDVEAIRAAVKAER